MALEETTYDHNADNLDNIICREPMRWPVSIIVYYHIYLLIAFVYSKIFSWKTIKKDYLSLNATLHFTIELTPSQVRYNNF